MTYPPRKYPSVIERLLARCEQRGDCWIWTGPVDDGGYCRIRIAGGMKVMGHRIAWMYFIGEIPDDLTFDHLVCQTPACVNPWHGELVPRVVNSLRALGGMAPINRAKTHCPAGHPYAGENLRVVGNARVCVACRRETNARYRARRKELADVR